MSNIFLDALAVDVERLQRINNTLKLLSPGRWRTARPIGQVIAPASASTTSAIIGSLPAPVRGMLRGGRVGPRQGTRARGVTASYLLFESPVHAQLVTLGMADTIVEPRRGASPCLLRLDPDPSGLGLRFGGLLRRLLALTFAGAAAAAVG